MTARANGKTELAVQMLPISRVKRYERNPRKNESAVAKVAASIQTFGWRQPIVVDQHMVIIAGDTRYLAALQLQQKQIPVHVAKGLTPAQVKAYRLADNRVAQEAQWDDERLAQELTDLQGLDFDLALSGFDATEISRLLDGEHNGASTAEQMEELEYRIVLDCADESEQRRLIERFDAEGIACRALIS